jgi:hypothetical protein
MKTPRCLGYATLGGRFIGAAYLGFEEISPRVLEGKLWVDGEQAPKETAGLHPQVEIKAEGKAEEEGKDA